MKRKQSCTGYSNKIWGIVAKEMLDWVQKDLGWGSKMFSG